MLWLKKHWDTLLLASVLILIYFRNYTPGTWLIGWDNLLPELNIWLNLKRSIFAVWQEYQGLGLVGGMGHATDLIRQLLLLPFILVLPHHLIRYLWHFAILALGTFGIHHYLKHNLKFSPATATISALFYLLNFGSVQYFWVAFEPFSTFWGFFPWLIFSLWNYLHSPSSSNLKKLALVNLPAVPSFYVQTIFVVYLICIFLVLFSFFIFSINNLKLVVSNSLKVLFLIFLINSFWLLPFGYFLKNNAYNPQQAYGNLMATSETVDRNIRRGYFTDFAILRGYYYDLQFGNSTLMAPWKSHFQNHYYLAAGYLLFFIALLGFVRLFFKTNLVQLSLILMSLFFATFLLSATPPFEQINHLIRSFSFLDQVFRSPWTKLIVPLIFSFSVCFGFGLELIPRIFHQLKYPTTNIASVTKIIAALLIICFSYPAFQGQYFSSHIKVKLPDSYLQLINFFKTKPTTARIMNLPQGSFWGWTNHNWGMSGSGFLWYGIPQPILDRAFDVWELNNQNYYFELTYALQSQNPQLLNQILQKYSVEYIVFDNSVFYPDEKIYNRQITPTYNLLTKAEGLKIVAKFSNITVYQYLPSSPYLSSDTNYYNLISLFPKSIPTTPNTTPIMPNPFISNTLLFNNTLSSKLTGFEFSDINLNQNYSLCLHSQHISGQPLTVSVFNSNTKYFTTKLSSSFNWINNCYSIPSLNTEAETTNLTILINNESFNYFPSINKLSSILLYPTNFVDTTPGNNFESITLPKFNGNIFTYQINLPANIQDKVLTLPQSFSPGWLAFYFDGLRPVFLKDHVLVNNWANGWNIPNDLKFQSSKALTFYILFWPQLLEFVGFFLLISTFIWIIYLPHNKKS